MINHIDDEVDPFESPLAKEFEQVCSDANKEILAKLDTARQALLEAIELAEKHGVPFRANISLLSNSYVPKSFGKTKFAALDREVVCEIAGVWGEYIGELFSHGGGWVHSAVC